MNIVWRWTEIWSLHLNRRTAIFITVLLVMVVWVFAMKSYSMASRKVSIQDFNPTPYSTIARCDREESGEINCPDIRHNGTTLLRRAQLVLTRLLRIFDLIAKKHGIRYWLYKGTLLGAVRHQGHNPFDNDVDICIPKADFEKFVKYGVSELPDDIFFQTEQTDIHFKVTSHSNMLGKLRDRKSCLKSCTNYCKHKDGLQLDMFVAESDSDGNFIEFYSHRVWFVRTFIYGPIVRKPSDIFPLTEVTFDGFSFPAPREWKKILTAYYGDFMTIPFGNPPGHVITDVSRGCEEIKEAR